MKHFNRKFNAAGGAYGFTLIEILVVITIIAVMTAAVVFGLSSKNPRRNLEEEAQRFTAKVALASEEAAFQGELLGIVFYRHEYQLMRWVELDIGTQQDATAADNTPQASGHWEKAGQNTFYKSVILPNDIELSLTVNDLPISLEESAQEDAEKKIEPVVLLLPSSEMTPFTLTFSAQDNPAIQVSVQGNELGELSMPGSDEKLP